MATPFDIGWLTESAFRNLLQANTSLENFFVSDDTAKRIRPCVIIRVTSSIEHKIGMLPPSIGGNFSGVFDQSISLTLELTADDYTEEQASTLWGEIYQALHGGDLLWNRITASISYPYTCYGAYPEGEATETVNEQDRIWQKSQSLKVIAMPRR